MRRAGPTQALGLTSSLRVSVAHQLRPMGITETHCSNQRPLQIKRPPVPQPVITSISPPGQEPSQWVTISGRNFKPGQDHFVRMTTLDLAEPRFWVPKTQATSTTQLRVQLPSSLLAGNYSFQVYVAHAPISDAANYTVAAPRYRIIFDRMQCLDESNPEWWGSDEIVTFWTVSADGYVWTKNTDEYGGFDDGDVKSYEPADRNILLPTGGWQECRHGLILITKLYEWDAGDVSAVQDFIGLVGHVAAGIAGFTVGLPVAAIIEAVAWVLNEVIGAIVSWFGGDPDHLGTRERAWSYWDLQNMVAPGGTYTGLLTFRNSGGTGSYRLHYQIMRGS